jgi:hypothetical protein
LQKLLLVYLPPGVKRSTGLRTGGRKVARKHDPQRDATHFMEAGNNALLRLGFHDSFDDLPGMIRGAVLKKSHLYDFRF